MTDDNPKPWYHAGLAFACQGSGNCCTGAPGYVWVTQAEIEALAAHLGLSPEEFEKRFVRAVGVRRSLSEFANGDCVFFDPSTRRCRVYDARPRQCRTWPFWPSNLQSRERWLEVLRACPGVGQGRLWTCEEIEREAAKVKV